MAERNIQNEPSRENEDAMLNEDEAEEIFDGDEDIDMEGEQEGGEEEDGMEQTLEEIQLQNDSAAHFDHHKDSIFSIAQHPLWPELIATGAGDDVAYLWEVRTAEEDERPVLPRSYESNPQSLQEREGLAVKAVLGEQDESVSAICFTLPRGEFVVTGTLAGKLSVYNVPDASSDTVRLLGFAKEVEEINWIASCPSAAHPNTIAFGASDNSVWVYTIDPSNSSAPLTIVQTYFLHQDSCTAGAWTPDGKLLATVSADGSLYVWDVFGDAAAAGVAGSQGGQAVIGLTAADERFRIEGGLYSVAVSPGGGIVAVGGAEGQIRVVGLPRLSNPAANAAANKGSKARPAPGKASAPASGSQVGAILASLQAQSDGVETLDFSQPPLTLLAAGSVDGSVVLFDAAHNFAVRRNIPGAHEEEAVIKVEFVKTPLGTPNPAGHLLTTCGNDGVVRRWDVRGGTSAGGKGLIGEWRGHRGGGEGGGILGFVQGGGGSRVITAGDDGVSLVFNTPL